MDSSRLPRLPAGAQVAVSAGQSHVPVGDRTRTCVAHDSQMVERSHSNRMPTGRRRDRRQRRGSSASTESSDEESCCCCPSSCCARNCNTQICCSYFMALLSSGLVVAGLYLSVVMWDRLWLIISLFGLVLVFVGACLYCCGVRALSRKYSCRSRSMEFDDAFDDETGIDDRHRARNKRKRRNRADDLDETTNDRRINAARSLSQLSLNMIPQYFAPSDTGSTAPGQLLASSRTNTLVTTASAAAAQNQSASVPFSQIFSLNGQSFLILPIANESLDASRQRNSTSSEQSIPLNSLVVKVPPSENPALSTDGNLRSVLLFHSTAVSLTPAISVINRPTVSEFLAKLDSKPYCLINSGQMQSSFSHAADDVRAQAEENTSLVSMPSSSCNLTSSGPSISCEDSGVNSISTSSQAKSALKDSGSVFVAINAVKSSAASCASSSIASVDVSSPSSSSSACLVAGSSLRHNESKHAKSQPPQPAARVTKSGAGPSVTKIDHSKFSVPDSSVAVRPKGQRNPDPHESATISNSFFISFPSEGSGKQSERGNPHIRPMQPSMPASSLTKHQKTRNQRKDASTHVSQNARSEPVAGPSTAASLIRRDTFSKSKKGATPLVPSQESESSSEISSPTEEPRSLAGGNLIDLIDRRRDSRAEAEAERTHAVFTSSGNHYEEIGYESSDLDDSEFLSPPPSYSEVIDGAMLFETPADISKQEPATGTL